MDRTRDQLARLSRFGLFKGDYENDFGHLGPLILRLSGAEAVVRVARAVGSLS